MALLRNDENRFWEGKYIQAPMYELSSPSKIDVRKYYQHLTSPLLYFHRPVYLFILYYHTKKFFVLEASKNL